MPRLSTPRLLSALGSEGAALADLAADHLGATIPTCPGWTVADGTAHTGMVHRRVVAIVRTGREVRRAELPAPPGSTELIGWYRDGLEVLLATLAAADADAEVWTFAATSPPTVGWWIRRMAQETAVHRWDVEAAVGPAPATGLAPDVAVEGIDEYLDDFLPGQRAAPGRAGMQGTLHLHATDAEGEWWVDLARAEAGATRAHARADTAVRGPASDLLLWLWNRQPASGRLEVSGDARLVEGWRSIRL